jgi:NADPH:quinone reductase-like Zn-dependent oxidoreductase
VSQSEIISSLLAGKLLDRGYSPVGGIIGADFAGTIAEIGSSVDDNRNLKIGDRVASYIMGGMRSTFVIGLPQSQYSHDQFLRHGP